jgi:hypothetical protein
MRAAVELQEIQVISAEQQATMHLPVHLEL